MNELDALKQDYHSARAPKRVTAEVVSRFSRQLSKRYLIAVVYVGASVAGVVVLAWALLLQPAIEPIGASNPSISLARLRTPNLFAISEINVHPGKDLQLSNSTGLLNKFSTLSMTQLPLHPQTETVQ